MSKFQRAERKRVKLKIAITGPSGSGKTYSALELASGLGQKIALIDTENDSASLYSDRFVFDTLVIDAPYTIAKYLEAFQAAIEEGYDVVVVDSISHAWAGEGGILDRKSSMDARGGNSYTNWSTLTPEQERFKSKILNSDIHMICTMRSKQEYVLEQNDKGKQAPRKVGMAPIQRDGMEYEFTTVFDVGMDHTAAASKDRTGLFDSQFVRISKETGTRFLTWLDGATAPARAAPVAHAPAVAESMPSFPTPKIAPPAAYDDDPGSYVMKMGKEYRGKRLDAFDNDQGKIYGFGQWLAGKRLEDPAKWATDKLAQETLDKIDLYLTDRQFDPKAQREGA